MCICNDTQGLGRAHSGPFYLLEAAETFPAHGSCSRPMQVIDAVGPTLKGFCNRSSEDVPVLSHAQALLSRVAAKAGARGRILRQSKTCRHDTDVASTKP